MEIDEKALMFDVQRGNLQKLAVLFERNKVPLFNYFRRMGNTPSTSEDLVQDTFVKVLNYRHSFNGSATFRSWLFGIGRNTMADHYRKLKSTDQQLDIDEQDVSAGAGLATDMEIEQQQRLFDKALALLPLELREILVLYRFHQLPYEEIASMQGCNLNTLKSRMRKAVSELQQQYQQLAGEMPA